MTSPRSRVYQGPPLLSFGFRPFFLAGTLYAAVAILLWLPMFLGELTLPTAFPPVNWHVHEMLYGFVPAVITGFLLTSMPGWTGQMPLQGGPLVVLAAIWLAGRLAVSFSAVIGVIPAAVIDCSFLAAVSLIAARDIIGGRNWRNLKVVGVIALLLAGNILFHIEGGASGSLGPAERLGIAAVVLLIVIIGGRIVPNFTRNWLMLNNPGRLPVTFSRFDYGAVGVSVVALVAWAAAGSSPYVGILFVLAAIAQSWRLARWASWRTVREPLLLIMHLAYAFIPAGFAVLAVAMILPETLPVRAGVHVWTVGAAGGMTLAVMTRASLGHTGRPLRASPATVVLYAALIVAVVSRFAVGLLPEATVLLLHVTAFSWLVAFGGFAIVYGPMLLRPRPGK